MNLGQTLPLLLKLALRNLWLYRLRTTVIGGLLGFGAFLAVVGLSLLRDVEFSMRESITGSVVGDIQIHSNVAKDELAVFGGGFMGRSDIGTMNDIAPIRAAALEVENVAAVLPMGLDMVFLGRGNELDDTLDALRDALKSGDQVIVTDRIDQLRFQISQLKLELAEQRKLVRDHAEIDAQSAAIATAESPGFLDTLKTLDETKLQFLETKIAPISGEKTPVYLNYVGTDVPLFQQNFPKFKIVEGETMPAGYRGILISRKFREDLLKNMAARLFDKLNKRITRAGMKIKGDAENTRMAADLTRQYPQVMAHLDRKEAQELSAELEAFGIAGEGADATDMIGKLTSQLKSFLKVDDGNFAARFAWFYEHVAHRIKLYEISPGETITLRSYTKSGYIKSVPLKVYGVYTFAGLEDSDLAGAMNVIDLVSFRELYGQMTEASRQELEAMRAQIGLREVAADNVEDALFGDSAAPIESVASSAASPTSETIEVKPVIADRFDVAESSSGLALNAALKLRDPTQLGATIEALKAKFKEKGFDLRVIDWQTAAGIAGQFVVMVRIALIFSLGVIFVVALVIINNSIVVGTLNRTREIGTMRAIGAQRGFVVGLFLAETGMTGLFGALIGATSAAAVLGLLAASGIPAPNDIVTFLFSGPRLYPMLRWPMVLAAPVIVTIIATVASIYAARHAAKIKPAEAMQEKE
jgi:ABC-type lipoprotein release transport system permease subunit